jgi:SAM-dependent methyltransferase
MPPRLDDMLNGMADYARACADYKARGVDRTLNRADRERSDEGSWTLQHYFEVGEDALRLIVGALVSTGRPLPKRILDFPSGSGRVTRHLRAFFPDAEIWASDIHDDHLLFCAEWFGVRTKRSHENLAMLEFECEFDLIFCGSLITHLPESDTRAALSLIARSLSPSGIALVTVHGRHSSHVQRHQWKYLGDDRFRIAEEAAERSGFGFVQYPAELRARLGTSDRYGVSLIRPQWLIAQLAMNPAVRILGYAERAWDNHQDVVTFGRPGVDQ